MNEMTDKMRVHYLSSNALDEIQSMLKQKDVIIKAQEEHIKILQDLVISLGGLIP